MLYGSRSLSQAVFRQLFTLASNHIEWENKCIIILLCYYYYINLRSVYACARLCLRGWVSGCRPTDHAPRMVGHVTVSGYGTACKRWASFQRLHLFVRYTPLTVDWQLWASCFSFLDFLRRTSHPYAIIIGSLSMVWQHVIVFLDFVHPCDFTSRWDIRF